jgi:hypothetical protein
MKPSGWVARQQQPGTCLMPLPATRRSVLLPAALNPCHNPPAPLSAASHSRRTPSAPPCPLPAVLLAPSPRTCPAAPRSRASRQCCIPPGPAWLPAQQGCWTPALRGAPQPLPRRARRRAPCSCQEVGPHGNERVGKHYARTTILPLAQPNGATQQPVINGRAFLVSGFSGGAAHSQVGDPSEPVLSSIAVRCKPESQPSKASTGMPACLPACLSVCLPARIPTHPPNQPTNQPTTHT